MSILFRSLCAACALLSASTIPGHAASVTIESIEGQAMYSQFGVAESTSVDGAEMAGMQVTAFYGDGSSESLTWQATGRRVGGVAGSYITMMYESGLFTLTVAQTLTSFIFETAGGNTFFDIIGSKGDDPTNTIGTDWGYPFRVEGGDPLTGEIAVTYENGLHVAGQARASDTFTKMTVDYSGLEAGGFFGTTIFKTDLDELAVPGDLSAVPLPAGMPLLLLAFGTLGLVHRRKA
jgi:hypothetical protein